MFRFRVFQSDLPLVPLFATREELKSCLLSHPKLDTHWVAKSKERFVRTLKNTQQSAWWIRSVRPADVRSYCPLSCDASWYPCRCPSLYFFSLRLFYSFTLVVRPCDLWAINTWWAVLGPSLLVGARRLGSAWSCLPCSVAWTLGLLGVPFLSISCSLTWEAVLVMPRCFPSWRRGSVWEINLYHWLAKPLWGLWSGFL